MEAISQKIKQLNTFGVQFIIRQDKLKDDKAPLCCGITVNGEIVHFALKKWIDPKLDIPERLTRRFRRM